MDKRKLHHYFTRLRLIPGQLFLVLAVVGLLIGLSGMRSNNLTAVRLREDLLKADQANGDVEAAMRRLRQHIYGHMHSSLSSGTGIQQPIQLKYRYERLVAAEKERVSKANEKIYTDAQADCERRFPVGLSGSGRIPCIEQYVSEKGEKERPIPDALYKFDFVSPVWSPDAAGLGLFVAGLSSLLFLVRLALEKWLHHSLDI